MSNGLYAIIGAGVAGVSAADALRREGFEGSIILVGEEDEAPYDRPPLSKKFLRGEVSRESVMSRPPDFFAKNAVDLRRKDPVTKIELDAKRIHLAQGAQIQYERLLITTGASPIRLRVPGHELAGIYYLRTLADCEHIRGEIRQGARVVVIGTGFIGCEVAASLRQIGCEVTIVGKGLPLEHVLGTKVGEMYAALYRMRGITLKTNASVIEFRGQGKVNEVGLSDGSFLACDFVIAGVGVKPAVDAVPSGITLDNGIATDEFCRTSVDSVWAAGDVAASWRPHLQRRVRFEHFVNAQVQGAAAAHSMLGKMKPYDPIPYFWSDQFDLSLQYYGYATQWDACVIRGNPSEFSLIAFYLAGGRIDAVCLVNQPKNIIAGKRLLGRTDILPSTLTDENVKLTELSIVKK